MVPVISRAGGMTLNASPEWMLQMLTTAVCSGLTFRETMPCKALMTWAAARMGSTAR